ncbi:MAG: pyruvate ferredoxin oxidoreductase [Candidatus Iainarchaeum archaeon]|uniref:pyruvate synthase n=1 Tax=Candidatus Iainarchaeum sp. TaxID=3101447 RepID=A0A497JH69_9ARCH|nr:MAG: pyruvate ferredoxin oxidoreductase [Candidatus Diapherotrites archaeon]
MQAVFEICIFGRGGQGAVTSSQLLALAAFNDGLYCQAFPMFGVERRGAPVKAFVRISQSPINIRQQVYNADCIIVLDSTLIYTQNIFAGLKQNGLAIINSDKTKEELFNNEQLNKFNIKTINVTKYALEIIGKPFVNAGILGAFAVYSGKISLEALKKAINERFKNKGAELNAKLAEKIYSLAEEEEK